MPCNQLLARVEPMHADHTILDHTVPATKQQHEVVARPSLATWRHALDTEEPPPAPRHRGNEMGHEPERMRASDSYWTCCAVVQPHPHCYNPAICEPAHSSCPFFQDEVVHLRVHHMRNSFDSRLLRSVATGPEAISALTASVVSLSWSMAQS